MSAARLLSLPAELRNCIYEHVLIDREPISLYFTHPADPIAQSCSGPALLHTCRQIRAEATQMYYSKNLFVVKTWHAPNCDAVLKAWLRAIRPDSRALIKILRIDDDIYSLRPTETRREWEKFLEVRRKRLEDIDEVVKGMELQVRDRGPASRLKGYESRWVSF